MLGEKKMPINTVFRNKDGDPVCSGWLPEGYKPAAAKIESDFKNIDMPYIVWLKAGNSEGKEWFWRFLKKYGGLKSKITAENRFMFYDEYLDTNAISLLNTKNIRLAKRFPLTDEELNELRNVLIKRRDSLLKLNTGLIEYIIQSIYGECGAKLYEADINGQKKYLVLTACIMGSEYGTFSRAVYNMNMQNQQMLNSMHSMLGSSWFGRQQSMPQQQPGFDVRSNVPFGQHRTDNLTSATLTWDILNFAGFISPVEPSESEVRDFLSFVRTAELHENFRQFIEQVQQVMINQKMQANKMIFNGWQQTMKVQQQCFDKSFNAMKSVSDMSFKMTQDRIASDNAAFDNSVRKQHEAIMGVNTYEKTDGSTVEFSVAADRVFQNTNDPSITVGIEGAGPGYVPFGWTELNKLK